MNPPLLWAASDKFSLIFHQISIANQSDVAIGCTKLIPFDCQLEFNQKTLRLCYGLPQNDSRRFSIRSYLNINENLLCLPQTNSFRFSDRNQ